MHTILDGFFIPHVVVRSTFLPMVLRAEAFAAGAMRLIDYDAPVGELLEVL